MKPPFMPVPEVGGVFHLRAATSKLPWKAKFATLMVGTDGHPEGATAAEEGREWRLAV